MSFRRRAALSILLGWASGAALAQHPVGGEFQVNSYTPGNQFSPAMAPDGSGGFVVVWSSDVSSGTDSSDRSVHGRLFAADGSPLGDDFQVNSYTTGLQSGGAVAPFGDSGFVVAWTSAGSVGSDSSEFSVQAQLYAADGSPLGGQFQVNTYTTGSQGGAAIGADGDGGFVIVWQSDGSSDTDTSQESVQAQRYTVDGWPIGEQFQVNTYTVGRQSFPAIGPDGGNGFVITWTSSISSGDDDFYSIWAQRYGPTGEPVGDEFQVNSYTPGSQFFSKAGSDGADGFVITWQSQLGSGVNTFGVRAQRYASNGFPLGDEFQVETYTTGDQSNPVVAPDGAGGFVIAWTSAGSYGSDTDYQSIQAQSYLADGTPLGGEFQVNTYTTLFQEFPAIAPVGAPGGFVIAWNSYSSSADESDFSNVQAQRYLPTEIFADGFESGDASAWSGVVP